MYVLAKQNRTEFTLVTGYQFLKISDICLVINSLLGLLLHAIAFYSSSSSQTIISHNKVITSTCRLWWKLSIFDNRIFLVSRRKFCSFKTRIPSGLVHDRFCFLSPRNKIKLIKPIQLHLSRLHAVDNAGCCLYSNYDIFDKQTKLLLHLLSNCR